MPTINFADLACDPDLGQPFAIVRSKGTFGPGGFKTTPQTIQTYGIIVPAGDQDLVQIPEGDRVDGSMMVITTTELYQTSESKWVISDKVQWRGDFYSVKPLSRYEDFGVSVAVLLRLTGS